MTKIITIQDRLEWTSYVQKSANYDCYHTWHYHSLDRSGKPILYVYQQGDDFIALPLIQRAIPDSEYFDLTCVYGYTGPISSKKMSEWDAQTIADFKSAFIDFLSAKNYVSLFYRLHPFFDQYGFLEKVGPLHDNGQTVAIDLSVSIDEQRGNYRQTTMDAIKQAWKKGFYIKDDNSDGAIDKFMSIYNETMQRVGATNEYYFDKHYFKSMLNNSEYEAKLLLVYDNDKAICGTIIPITGGIIQAHLMGTRMEYLRYSPAKFLVDEITLIGRCLGSKYFNLGGGLGFKDDSLFQWKTSFSDLHLDYKSWRYVANPQLYDKLLAEKGIDKNLDVDFFPLYRHNKTNLSKN